MTLIPPPDPNPLAVLFAAIAAMCILSLCGMGLWGFGYDAAHRDLPNCYAQASKILDRP